MPKYFATTARGIEEVTAAELKALGMPVVEAGHGGVFFEGGLEDLYRANLWLRTATRILVPLREFSAKTSQMLYDQARRVKWDQFLSLDHTFAITSTMTEASAGIRHSGFGALKIKDAIVDQFRSKTGSRPNVDTRNPDIRIHAYFHGGRCSLSLDASGTSLHERGYRLKGAGAPLKETLAAAIIELSGWDGKSAFLDPMCGSGTLALEAALKANNIAPGLLRTRFGFETWPSFDAEAWRRVREQAQEAVRYSGKDRSKDREAPPILGYDANREAIATAIENCKRAGLSRSVHFERRNFEDLEPPAGVTGTVIVNPPYGERLGEVEELRSLYKLIGDQFKQRLKGWTGFVFTGNRELAKSVGLHASRRIPLFNGPIECRLLKYDLY